MSHALLQAWAKTLRRRAEQTAVVEATAGRTVTFRELDARAAAWLDARVPDRRLLRQRGVVFAAANGIGWFELFIGLLKAGAVSIPLDAAEPAEAQRRLAESLRAGYWWDGTRLVALTGAPRSYQPTQCLIKLTSGSTGEPKPLVFSAEQLLADGRQVTSTMRIRTKDLNYALIPLGHSYGFGNLVIPLLAQGIPLVCGAAALPHAIAQDFARWRPTVFPGVPVIWRALAGSEVTLESLRLGISAGAPLPPEVAEAFAARFGQRLHGFYGSSETGGIAYDRNGRATLAGRIGGALRGVKLSAKPRHRLQVSSAAVLTQGNPRRENKHGAWIMPDRVLLSNQGEVTLLGRRDKTVKLGGRRVNLGEVAARLRRLAGVREAWVGVSEAAEPVLGAVVASERSATELRAELQADTAAWKIPKKISVVATLPLTSRGKLDTQALRTLVFRPPGR